MVEKSVGRGGMGEKVFGRKENRLGPSMQNTYCTLYLSWVVYKPRQLFRLTGSQAVKSWGKQHEPFWLVLKVCALYKELHWTFLNLPIFLAPQDNQQLYAFFAKSLTTRLVSDKLYQPSPLMIGLFLGALDNAHWIREIAFMTWKCLDSN